MLDFSSEDLDTIVSDFEMVIENVTAASVTYSIRDSVIGNVEIKKDDYIAIVNGSIVAANKGKIDIVKDLFAKVEDINYKEVVTLIYGKDVTDEEKTAVVAFINETYPDIEVGEVDGMQDVYSFIISIE